MENHDVSMNNDIDGDIQLNADTANTDDNVVIDDVENNVNDDIAVNEPEPYVQKELLNEPGPGGGCCPRPGTAALPGRSRSVSERSRWARQRGSRAAGPGARGWWRSCSLRSSRSR